MAFNYSKLWKLLIDKNMNKTALKEKISTTPATIARLSKNQYVSMEILDRICNELDCDIVDIVEHVNIDKLSGGNK